MRLPSSIHSCRRTMLLVYAEDLTTWRFMGLAHDEDEQWFLSDDIVAQEDLMVQLITSLCSLGDSNGICSFVQSI